MPDDARVVEPEGVVACALRRREWMIIYRALIYSLGAVAEAHGVYGEADARLATKQLVAAMKADAELAGVVGEYDREREEKAARRRSSRHG